MTARILLVALAALAAVLPSTAHALWSISLLSNLSNKTVTLTVPFAPGAYPNFPDTLANLGDMALTIPGKGVVYFEDKGHYGGCSRPYWGVRITYNSKVWGYFYDGNGRILVLILTDGSPQFLPGKADSQVVTGDGPPKCIRP